MYFVPETKWHHQGTRSRHLNQNQITFQPRGLGAHWSIRTDSSINLSDNLLSHRSRNRWWSRTRLHRSFWLFFRVHCMLAAQKEPFSTFWLLFLVLIFCHLKCRCLPFNEPRAQPLWRIRAAKQPCCIFFSFFSFSQTEHAVLTEWRSSRLLDQPMAASQFIGHVTVEGAQSVVFSSCLNWRVQWIFFHFSVSLFPFAALHK